MLRNSFRYLCISQIYEKKNITNWNHKFLKLLSEPVDIKFNAVLCSRKKRILSNEKLQQRYVFFENLILEFHSTSTHLKKIWNIFFATKDKNDEVAFFFQWVQKLKSASSSEL